MNPPKSSLAESRNSIFRRPASRNRRTSWAQRRERRWLKRRGCYVLPWQNPFWRWTVIELLIGIMGAVYGSAVGDLQILCASACPVIGGECVLYVAIKGCRELTDL